MKVLSVKAVGTLAIWGLIEPVPPLLLKVTVWFGQRRPLGIQGDVRCEGIGGAIGIGSARAVGSCVPAAERVAYPGEGVERQCGWDVGDLGTHRACPAVAVEGHGVVRQRRPLGIQGDVRREGVGCAIGIGSARAVSSCVPAAERVACPGEGVERQGGWDVGDLVDSSSLSRRCC